ncbi:MAG: hypothetical protein KGI75_32125, partial [Rhizobiaceae bacterium]|nr:hypothetical protein [Rhizobiaceae bacterium]
GGRLALLRSGQITGGLIIDDGGQADVHGQICRDVINHGSLTLTGQVVGMLHGNRTVNPAGSGQIIGMPLPIA